MVKCIGIAYVTLGFTGLSLEIERLLGNFSSDSFDRAKRIERGDGLLIFLFSQVYLCPQELRMLQPDGLRILLSQFGQKLTREIPVVLLEGDQGRIVQAIVGQQVLGVLDLLEKHLSLRKIPGGV